MKSISTDDYFKKSTHPTVSAAIIRFRNIEGAGGHPNKLCTWSAYGFSKIREISSSADTWFEATLELANLQPLNGNSLEMY